MADNEQKAHQLVEEARAKLRGTSSGFFSFIFGGSSKEEEGLEMLGRAANLYKMSKNWGKAGMLSLVKKEEIAVMNIYFRWDLHHDRRAPCQER